MTRASIKEYADVIRQRCRAGHKTEKGKILGEFTKVTGLHRKATICLLRNKSQRTIKKKRGRTKYYGSEVTSVLRRILEASDRLCPKRLQPFIPEMMRVLRQHRELQINMMLESQLCQISPATIDRLLKPWRVGGAIHRLKERLPFPLLGLDSDNGSEFINQHLDDYCRHWNIKFTRSHSYK